MRTHEAVSGHRRSETKLILYQLYNSLICVPLIDLKALDFINPVPCVCQSEDTHVLQPHLKAYMTYWQLMKNLSLISHFLPSWKTQHKELRWA